MRIFISVAEISGDLVASRIVATLKQQFPHAEFFGITGPHLRSLDVQEIHPVEDLCVMGLIEVLRHLPRLLRIRTKVKRVLKQLQPDLLIAVDAPDFNLPLACYAKQHLAIKTVIYNSPSVWAWRRKRIYQVERAADCLLCLLPFEPQYYSGLNLRAVYIGHPLADELQPDHHTSEFRTQLGLQPNQAVIALLPGSRSQEIEKLFHVFLQTAMLLKQQFPQLQFIVPAVNAAKLALLQKIKAQQCPDLAMTLHLNDAYSAIKAADAVLVASGTATLETMLLARPMVVAYKLSRLTYAIAKRLVKLPYVALPNLLAGKQLVPEFIQDAATPDVLAKAMTIQLQSSSEHLMIEFAGIAQQLRCASSQQAVMAIKPLLTKEK